MNITSIASLFVSRSTEATWRFLGRSFLFGKGISGFLCGVSSPSSPKSSMMKRFSERFPRCQNNPIWDGV